MPPGTAKQKVEQRYIAEGLPDVQGSAPALWPGPKPVTAGTVAGFCTEVDSPQCIYSQKTTFFCHFFLIISLVPCLIFTAEIKIYFYAKRRYTGTNRRYIPDY
jgi:hypothetical protein